MSEKVYELIDHTSDEIYWPLGLFVSLEQVVGKLKEDMTSTERFGSHWNDGAEYEILHVVERVVGVYDQEPKTVYKLERKLENIDEDYTEHWKIVMEEYL